MEPERYISKLNIKLPLAPSGVTLLNYDVLKKVAKSSKEHFSQRHFIPKPYSLDTKQEEQTH
ncbi:CLUMA_CG020503, isoform A [Clunio marinus]|uniref:CLUMA_CG020503, isoform A n=1 Tax=Clunio marinus TaxID=568069 RepID=A0A1J1J6E1_9DIPT|nr:CLUMA_CG020503, isoform A [Clunio marinus]